MRACAPPGARCWSVLLAHALYTSNASAPADAPPLFDFAFKLGPLLQYKRVLEY